MNPVGNVEPMAEPGITITPKEGVFHLSGVLNEYADFTPLLQEAEPLRLNIRKVSRLNSIGIRNLLKFLSEWGAKAFTYEECPSEFVDQINMIPAMLGTKAHGQVVSLFVPYECGNCDNEEEILADISEYKGQVKAGEEPPRKACSKCGSPMSVLMDSFFVFLTRQK
jgi:hypothetical protein